MTTTGTSRGLITNKDFLAVTDGTPQAGSLVWWELSGLVDAQALRTAWDAAGLDAALVPEDPPPRTALKCAVETLAEQRKLVRPLAGREGYSLVEETAEGEALSYKQSVVATVNDLGQLKVELVSATEVQSASGSLAESIKASYQRHLDNLVPSDISTLLVRFTESLDAVALRARGGFYFLPPASVDKFRLAAQVIRSVGAHVCYEIPALRTESAVQAILAAVEREAAAEIAEFELILTNTEAGPRALKTQSKKCDRVATKVASYEALLGTSLVELQERLAGLRSRLAEATLLAQAQDAAA
jgi:hypothetical protein